MEIKAFAKNAKKHPREQLKKIAASIERFGFRQPIIVDKEGVIVVGHGRYLAAKDILKWETLEQRASSKKGEKVIPYQLVDDLTQDEVNAYRLADNRLNETDWEMELLAESLKELPEDLQKLTGFEDEEIAKALGKAITGEEDDFDTTPPEEPKSKLGDLYQLGDHRLLCGNSTKPEDVERLMQGEKADMVFTDPPYGIGIASNPVRQAHEKKDWDEKTPDAHYFVDLLEQAEKQVIWGGNYFDLPPSQCFLVWDKKQPEDFSLAMCEMAWTNVKMPAKMFRMSVTSYQKDHPTQKPIELIVWAMEITDGGKIVFDLFGGSGSTLIACEQTGRKCRMMEIDPKYCDVILNRWSKLTGKDPIRSDGIFWSEVNGQALKT